MTPCIVFYVGIDYAALVKSDNRRARRNAMTIPNGSRVTACAECSRNIAEQRLAAHVRYSHIMSAKMF